jgi:hypothetical protein
MESNDEIQKIIEDMPLNDMQANLKLLSLSDQSILRQKQTNREFSLDKSPLKTQPRMQMRPIALQSSNHLHSTNRGLPLASAHATLVAANSPLHPSFQLGHVRLSGGPMMLSELGALSHTTSGQLLKNGSLRHSLKTRKGVTAPSMLAGSL